MLMTTKKHIKCEKMEKLFKRIQDENENANDKEKSESFSPSGHRWRSHMIKMNFSREMIRRDV